MAEIPIKEAISEQEEEPDIIPSYKVSSLELLSILPEGVDVKFRKLPKDEQNSPIYDDPRATQYYLFDPRPLNEELFEEIMRKYNFTPETPVLILPYGEKNKIGYEARPLYFTLVVDNDGRLMRSPHIENIKDKSEKIPSARIISFGNCNVACPYCKRDCQFVNEAGIPIISLPVPLKAIGELAEGAYQRGEVIRFSGGDPVVYPRQVLALSEYINKRYGAKVSIAHNGSGPRWVERMLPYLSSAAIDLKAVPELTGRVMGISEERGKKMHKLSLETQKIISQAGVLLDVRTPIFGDTTTEQMARLAESICRENNLDYTFWTWRLYKPVEGCDFVVPKKENTIKMLVEISKRFPELWIGIRAKWEKGGMLYFRGGEMVSATSEVTNQDLYEIAYGEGVKMPD